MRPFKFPILISIMLHLLLFSIFYYTRLSIKTEAQFVEMDFLLRTTAQPGQPAVSVPSQIAHSLEPITEVEPRTSELIAEKPPETTVTLPSEPSVKAPGYYEILTGTTDSLRKASYRRFQFLKSLQQAPHDSAALAQIILKENLTRIVLPKRQLEATFPGADRVAGEISRRNTGHGALASVTPLMRGALEALPTMIPQEKKANERGSLHFVPSVQEIEVLKALWEQKEATGNTIYAQLDSVPFLTAEDLFSLLDDMVNKGLLTRKKISPQNLFRIQAPLGGINIEMSELNRKNPVFLYRPLVKKKKVILFLFAQLYRLDSGDDVVTTKGMSPEKLRSELLDRILRLTSQ